MAQRPAGCQSKVMTADGEVDPGPKPVYALIISCEGATAGDKVALRDKDAAGEIRVIATIKDANGTFDVPLGRYGIQFTGAIYYTEQATAAKKIRTTVVFG